MAEIASDEIGKFEKITSALLPNEMYNGKNDDSTGQSSSKNTTLIERKI